MHTLEPYLLLCQLDDIRACVLQVYEAVEAMRRCHELLVDGNLIDAYQQSKKALQASGRNMVASPNHSYPHCLVLVGSRIR